MYNSVLSDRKKLEGALSHYQPLVYSVIFRDAKSKPITDDKKLEELTDAWLRKVEHEGGEFRFFKDMGINIFTGCYSGSEKIDFSSNSLYVDFLMGGNFEGVFSVTEGTKLLRNMPRLRNRLSFFILSGHIHPTTIILAHELLHKQQFNVPGCIDYTTISKEAQCYLLELLYSDKNFIQIAEKLTIPQYGFGTNAIEGINIVLSLYAIGVPHSEITSVVSHSYYNPETGKLAITEELMYLQKECRIDDEDLEALKDVYKIKVKNQLLKARLLFFETIDEKFSYTDMYDIFIGRIRKGIAIPTLFVQGNRTIPPDEALLQVVCPANEEFPYTLGGKRTGIIFGFLPGRGRWELDEHADFKFGIGRWECTEDRRTVISRACSSEEEKYLKILSEKADTIEVSSKTSLFKSYFNLISTEPLALKILRALISDKEMKEIFDISGLAYIKTREDKIKAIGAEIEKTRNEDAAARFSSVTKQFFSNIERLENTFGIDVEIGEREFGMTSKISKK